MHVRLHHAPVTLIMGARYLGVHGVAAPDTGVHVWRGHPTSKRIQQSDPDRVAAGRW